MANHLYLTLPLFHRTDYKNYLKLRQIKAFYQYRISKAFTIWRKTVKRQKYEKNRNILEKQLFIAIPTLAAAILQMRHEFCQFIDFKFFDTSDKMKWNLQYFLEIQINTCEQVRGLLVAYRQKMKDVLCMTLLVCIHFNFSTIFIYPSLFRWGMLQYSACPRFFAVWRGA